MTHLAPAPTQSRCRGEGAARQVALETVQGRLAGRYRSFALRHSSTRRRGEAEQSIAALPDSGANELQGMAGHMRIDIDGQGAHSYRFEFTLAGAHG